MPSARRPKCFDPTAFARCTAAPNRPAFAGRFCFTFPRGTLAAFVKQGKEHSSMAKNGKPMKDAPHEEDHVYKVIELAGASGQSFDRAVHNALTRAGKTIRNMRWFQVTETRGTVENGKVAQWQVMLKVGFRLDEGG
jgi:flavin-binding protein dodecin